MGLLQYDESQTDGEEMKIIQLYYNNHNIIHIIISMDCGLYHLRAISMTMISQTIYPTVSLLGTSCC